MGVDDHGAVVAGVDPLRRVAVAEHRPDDAVELPRGGRAAGVEEVPGDVDLERGVDLRVDHLPVAGQVHQLVQVEEDGAGRGAENGDAAHPMQSSSPQEKAAPAGAQGKLAGVD